MLKKIVHEFSKQRHSIRQLVRYKFDFLFCNENERTKIMINFVMKMKGLKMIKVSKR